MSALTRALYEFRAGSMMLVGISLLAGCGTPASTGEHSVVLLLPSSRPRAGEMRLTPTSDGAKIAAQVEACVRRGDFRFLADADALVGEKLAVTGLSARQLAHLSHLKDIDVRGVSSVEILPVERDHQSYLRARDKFDAWLAEFNRRIYPRVVKS